MLKWFGRLSCYSMGDRVNVMGSIGVFGVCLFIMYFFGVLKWGLKMKFFGE